MRIRLAGVLAAVLLLQGCLALCPPSTAIPIHTRWDTPTMAFETFRDALKAGLPEVVYETLSPGFKEKYGVPGYGKFKIGFQHYREDFDALGRLLDNARAVKPIRYEERGGRTYAYVSLASGEARGDFVLVDLPSWEAVVDFEEYDAETVRYYLKGKDFGSVLLVKDGKIYVGPLDAAETGVMDPSEIKRLSIQHQWLLHDIERLTNVRALLERLESASGSP